MEIRIDRKWRKSNYTISRLYVNGQFFGCNTIEDTDRGLTQDMTETEIRKKKLYGKTAIPSGRYNVVMSMSAKFGKMLPEIQNVKGFSGVRIHSGNSAEDSLGCILPGVNDKVGWVSNSRLWTNKLIDQIRAALARGEKVTLTIDK